MEKTINCAEEECGMAFTYEVPTKYLDTRKYCPNCSAKNKKDFTQDKGDRIDLRPVIIGTHVEKPHDNTKQTWDEAYIKPNEPKTNGFKLTEENIRIGAATLAVECGLTPTSHEFWSLVRIFEEYIRNGK